MNRRYFLQQSSRISLGFLSLHAFVSACGTSTSKAGPSEVGGLHNGYGPLMPDPDGILRLPQGFSYKIISRRGDQMDDGLFVPGMADGMATFPASNGKVLIIRNHEVSPGNIENGAFGPEYRLLNKIAKEKLYDYGKGQFPCLGGTTTLLFNPETNEVERQYLSLAGTIRNCAGGPTPWNSWISCEEDTTLANENFEQNHGYCFDVPASEEIQLFDPIPLKEMGRFNHEAVCVDPRTGIVYQTEDRNDGLIYRYLPNEPGQLHKGGKLQLLALKDEKSFDTRNWESDILEVGKAYAVEWLDIDGIDAPRDDLRYRGFEVGAARFARGEGMWFGDNEVYFACTNGGKAKSGQVFKYIPGPYEGQSNEMDSPGQLILFVEPNNTDMVEACDNLTVAPNGDLVLCEDKGSPRIVGVTPQGEIYHIAHNVGYTSEFAGASFSPDGSYLFVNIQKPGLTFAISGPWGQRNSA